MQEMETGTFGNLIYYKADNEIGFLIDQYNGSGFAAWLSAHLSEQVQHFLFFWLNPQFSDSLHYIDRYGITF